MTAASFEPQPGRVITAPDGRDVLSRARLELYAFGLAGAEMSTLAALYGSDNSIMVAVAAALLPLGFGCSLLVRRYASPQIRDAICFIAFLLVAIVLVTGTGSSQIIDLSKLGTGDTTRPLLTLLTVCAAGFSFALVTDTAVLLLAVPGLSALSVTVLSSSEPAVRTLYFGFLACSALAMSREVTLQRGFLSGVARTRGGYVSYAALCVCAAAAAAGIVAGPMTRLAESAGIKKIFVPKIASETASGSGAGAFLFGGTDRVAIASAPGSQRDVPVLLVQCTENQYLRGHAYDHYDGTGFDDTVQLQAVANGTVLPAPVPSAGRRLIQQYVTVLRGTVGEYYAIETPSQVWDGHAPTLRFSEATVRPVEPLRIGSRYGAWSAVAVADRPDRGGAQPLDAEARRRYLQTRTDNPEAAQRLAETAANIATADEPLTRAIQLKQWVASQCAYTLTPQASGSSNDAVINFLFESRQGFCTSFAAALTVLCRHAGVPARFVTGFLPGDRQPDGSIVIRERMYHAWCEIYLAGAGWVPVDATDGAATLSSGLPVPGAPHRSRWLPRGISPVVLAGSFVAVLILVYVIATELYRFRRPQAGRATDAPSPVRVTKAYRRAVRLLCTRSGLPGPAITPNEYLDGMDRHSHAYVPMKRLTEVYCAAVYGETTTDMDDEAASLAKAVERAIAADRERSRRGRSPGLQE